MACHSRALVWGWCPESQVAYRIAACVFLSLAAFGSTPKAADEAAAINLFDGKTLTGWEGDPKTWRVQDGAITGGSLTETVPQNEFLSTTKTFRDFDLRLKLKLTGSEGFINSGVQIRSVRVPNSSKVSGYQVDYGKGYYGMLYDESRRNRMIAESGDMAAVAAVVREGDWNEYRILAQGPRIRTWINGVPALDYTEREPGIAQEGIIAIQVHGGGKALIQIKDVVIEKLPPLNGAESKH